MLPMRWIRAQNPDWRLINALGVLRTDHELIKTSFNDQLARLQSIRKLRKRLTHPGVEHDKLFKTAYPHRDEEKSGVRTAILPGL